MRSHRNLLGTDFTCRWKHLGRHAEGEHPRPRVLVEEPDVAGAYAYWRLLDNNGYEVSWCRGPKGLGPRPCPLVTCGRCELVERADVVVSSLGLHRESSRKVVAALRRLHPDTPVVIQASQQMFTRWAPLFEGHWGPVPIPANKRTLLDSVESALAKPTEESPNHIDAHLLPNATGMVNSSPNGRDPTARA
jgi:DNA-binding NtrC family response regulator